MYDHRCQQNTHFIWVTLWQFLHSRKLQNLLWRATQRGRWKGSFQGRCGKEGELTCLDDVVQQHLESLLRLESCKGHLSLYVFVAIQLLNHIWLFATLWTATLQASLSFIISQSLLKYISIESVFPSIAQSPAPGKHWSTVGLCDLPV